MSENNPDFDLGNHGRPSAMPTPPGAELAGGKPVTNVDSKEVMLRAERNDEITIQQVVRGLTNVPETFTVLRRTQTYYGPNLLLHTDVNDEDQNWLLTCPGPNTQLILWKAVTGKDHRRRSGWHPVSEIKAAISDMKQYNICDVCDRPLRGLWHERLSAIGACEGIEL